MPFFKEIKEFFRFARTKKEDKELVVYAEDSSSFSFFEGLVYELQKRDISFCYISSDPNDPILNKNTNKFHTFYIKHLIGFFTTSFSGKMLVMTMPDLDQFHIKKPANNTVNLIYLFHNMGSYFQVLRHKALFAYNTFFCVGPHHLKELKKEEELYSLPKRNLVQFGYYRLDKIIEQYAEWKKKHKEKSKYKAKILFAPGWGPWDERNSALDVVGRKLIEKLVKANYEVVLRPHPMTRKKYPEVLDKIYEDFKEYKNFTPEENISTLDSFFSADVMISDWSGVVYEFAFGTKKPVLFIDVPLKVNNQEYKKFDRMPIDVSIREKIGKVMAIEDVEKIETYISELIQKKESLAENIETITPETVFNIGSSSESGADYIESKLLEKANG